MLLVTLAHLCIKQKTSVFENTLDSSRSHNEVKRNCPVYSNIHPLISVEYDLHLLNLVI